MAIYILDNPEELGEKAADLVVKKLNEAIERSGQARIVLSTGASRFETIKYLVEKNVDQEKVTVFHLDEYLGLPETHEASFRRYLKKRFTSKVPAEVRFVSTEGDVEENLKELIREIRKDVIDIGVIGIGKNGHIAFNDPSADFETQEAYRTVALEERCRKQQLSEGWFPTLDEVLSRAVSITPYQIMQYEAIVSSVSGKRKAEAVRNTLKSEGVTSMVPTTLFKTHKDWHLLLDEESSSLINSQYRGRRVEIRRMISVLLVSILAVNLDACSSAASKASKEIESAAPAGTTTQESGKKRTLRIAGESWQVTELYLNKATETSMKNRPDVTIGVQAYADPTVISNYSINWQKGDTPYNLVVIDGASSAGQFVTKDLIYDFDQDLKFFNTYSKDKFILATLEMAKLHDKQYVIPVIQEVTAININKVMFKDTSLVGESDEALVPKTWDGVHEFAKKLTRTGDGVVTQQGRTIQQSKDIHGTILGVLQASCGGLYQDDGITANFQSQEFKDILIIWWRRVKDGVFSTETFTDYNAGKNSYKAGEAVMLLQSGSNWVEAIPTTGEENASAVPIPGGEENRSVGYVNDVIIPKCSPSSGLAVQFVQERLLGEYTQTSTVNRYGKIPIITEYYSKTESPNWQNIKGSVEKAVTYPPSIMMVQSRTTTG